MLNTIKKVNTPNMLNGPSDLLQGIRVLDFTRLLPGPMCTQFLADLGATVIKVEDTQTGDYLRWIPPLAQRHSRLFLALNRGKKSLCLNLQAQEECREILSKLVPTIDVVVEGFRPGVAQKLGIDYPSLKKWRPDLVYASLSGFGQEGELASMAGHDLNYQALAGTLQLAVDERGDGASSAAATVPKNQWADMAAGAMMANSSILAALLKSKTRHIGSYLDISMLDALLGLQPVAMASYSSSRPMSEATESNSPWQKILTGGTPSYHIYETSDQRLMALGTLEKKFWVAFCQKMNLPHLVEQHLAFEEQGEKIYRELSTYFKSKTQKQWMEFFQGSDCCCTPVFTAQEVWQEPHLRRSLQQTISIPTEGEIAFSAFPCKVDGRWHGQIAFPPQQGEHTTEILMQIGLLPEKIKQWQQRGIIL